MRSMMPAEICRSYQAKLMTAVSNEGGRFVACMLCQTQNTQVVIDREKTVLQRKALAPVVLTTWGRVVAVEGIACAGGNVAAAEAEAMVASATAVLRARLTAVAGPPAPATAGGGGEGREDTTVRIDVKVEVDSRTFSSGGGLRCGQ